MILEKETFKTWKLRYNLNNRLLFREDLNKFGTI
jgi:hypothetical protein